MHYKSVKQLNLDDLEKRAEDFKVHPHVTNDDLEKLKKELFEFKEEETKFFPSGQNEFDHLNFHYSARKKRPAM